MFVSERFGLHVVGMLIGLSDPHIHTLGREESKYGNWKKFIDLNLIGPILVGGPVAACACAVSKFEAS